MNIMGISYQFGAMAAENNPLLTSHLAELITIIGHDEIDVFKFREGFSQQLLEKGKDFIESEYVESTVTLKLMSQNLANKYLYVTECLNKKILVEIYDRYSKENERFTGQIVRLDSHRGEMSVTFRDDSSYKSYMDFSYSLRSFKIIEVLADAEPIKPKIFKSIQDVNRLKPLFTSKQS